MSYSLSLMKDLQRLNQIANGKTQVQQRTKKQREETINRVFDNLGIERYKYLDKAKSIEKQNEELQRAANTLSKITHRELYKPIRHKDDERIKKGLTIKNYQYKDLKQLEETFNVHKERKLKEFIKENPKLSKSDIDFLKGKRIKNANGEQEIQLPISFAKEDFFKQIDKDVNINYFIGRKEKQLKDFTVKVGQYSNARLDRQLDTWVEGNGLNEDQKDIIISHFNNLKLTHKYNFNQEFEKRIAWVESIVSNPRSKYGYFEAMMEIVLKQEDLVFNKAGYDI